MRMHRFFICLSIRSFGQTNKTSACNDYFILLCGLMIVGMIANWTPLFPLIFGPPSTAVAQTSNLYSNQAVKLVGGSFCNFKVTWDYFAKALELWSRQWVGWYRSTSPNHDLSSSNLCMFLCHFEASLHFTSKVAHLNLDWN